MSNLIVKLQRNRDTGWGGEERVALNKTLSRRESEHSGMNERKFTNYCCRSKCCFTKCLNERFDIFQSTTFEEFRRVAIL